MLSFQLLLFLVVVEVIVVVVVVVLVSLIVMVVSIIIIIIITIIIIIDGILKSTVLIDHSVFQAENTQQVSCEKFERISDQAKGGRSNIPTTLL